MWYLFLCERSTIVFVSIRRFIYFLWFCVQKFNPSLTHVWWTTCFTKLNAAVIAPLQQLYLFTFVTPYLLLKVQDVLRKCTQLMSVTVNTAVSKKLPTRLTRCCCSVFLSTSLTLSKQLIIESFLQCYLTQPMFYVFYRVLRDAQHHTHDTIKISEFSLLTSQFV